MSGWTNKESLAFLEAYQAEPCIWNPKEIDHKDKKKVADAWLRISQIIGKPVKELKAKKEILMTTFRKHLKRKQHFIRSGTGTEEEYRPHWFAYEFMESFLMPVYASNNTSYTEMQSQQNIDEISNGPTEGETDNDPLFPDTDTLNTPRPISTQSQSRRPSAPSLAEQMAAICSAAAYEQVTNVLRRPSQCETATEDECDLYGKLLAIKLREMPKYERQMLMYEIDGLFIKRLKCNRETHSP